LITGLVTSGGGISLLEWLLKEKYKGMEDDEEDISSFWMTFRKGEGTAN
jgi:hypothetical protein